MDEPISIELIKHSPTPPLPAKKQINPYSDAVPSHSTSINDIQNANIPPPKLLSRASSVVPSSSSIQELSQVDSSTIRPHPKLARQQEIPEQSQSPYRIPSPCTPDYHQIERPSSVMLQSIHPMHSAAVSPTNSLFLSPISIGVSSPLLNDSLNVTIVQEGKIQPYHEEEKPFEMSDFYKYSTKFRQKQMTTNGPNNGN